MTPQPMGVKIEDKMDDVIEVFLATDRYATTGYLVDETGYSRPTVSKRLDRLHAAECIEYVHPPTAFWRLVEDPREDEGDESV